MGIIIRALVGGMVRGFGIMTHRGLIANDEPTEEGYQRPDGIHWYLRPDGASYYHRP